MKIYIPSYLRKIKLIDQLYQLIENYDYFYEKPSNSFDDYYYSLKIDPVKRFLNQCIDIDSTDQLVRESTINYISKLFYSVKGTIKVFEYMRRYLNLKFEGDIIYTTHYIEIKLSKNKVSDESSFYKNIKEFLNALIYYQELKLIIDTTELVIKNDVYNYVGYNIINYNKLIID